MTYGPDAGVHALLDWDLAVATATRLTRPGPAVTAEQARAVVSDLRRHARDARAHVRTVTGLDADSQRGDAGGLADERAALAVIDRPGWIRANAAGFRTILEPIVEKLRERRAKEQGKGPLGPLSVAVGSRVTAVETGALLAFLAGKVLGQYELFPPYGSSGAAVPQGRLLLVAPNIVAAEREMSVDSRDFRLWVCIHEETHRVQFGAVPWLREHVMSEVRAYLDETDVDPAVLLRRLRAAVGAVGDALRGGPGHESTSLLEALQTPAQREVLDRLTAVMSLLEGHADHVMDAVGPDVIPSVDRIRARFQQRRQGAGRLDQVLRRLLGIDAKMRQYRDGARFVGTVVDRVGMAGFNRVWDSPVTLPTSAEISAPDAWIARVLGQGPPAQLKA